MVSADEGFPNTAKHQELHGFYQDLHNKRGVTCCHNRDCRPTSFRDMGDHMEVMLNGKWIQVDPDKIVNKTAPDWGAHICAGDPTDYDTNGRIWCIIIPPRS